MKVRAFAIRDQKLDDWERRVEGRWSIEALRADERYRDGWLSIDCLAWDGDSGKMYLGLTLINTDIFWTFDTGSSTFTSLDFPSVSDRFDAKLHRSLERDTDGSYIIATAMLHDMNQQFVAGGGKLMRYDPEADLYDLLDVPIPGQYIQSVVLDRDRRLVYGFTYPAEYMFVHDLTTMATRKLAYLGNSRMICQPHNAVIDTRGRVWGTWGENRAFEYSIGETPIRYFCYDPGTERFEWFEYGPPHRGRGDTGAVDHMLLSVDGLIYVGTVAGALSTLDPETGNVVSLGQPFQGSRLAGLVEARDGHIYGAGNSGLDSAGRGTARLFRYDRATERIDDLGKIFDEDRDDGAVKVHMLVEGEDGVLYAGENDNRYRSSYLWRCQLDV
ncbi:hypothetical protein E3O45_07855 [Cryobacterium sp. TMS1-20-1]|uniref:hypothetical protein n=1 Tax=Cryobacterium sp. TMS1-20-1 TaxID=1259223 RepID=UPI00106BFA30|nr:hypothetical protein [Cryobacterium sp. TMS1-20-1]TFC77264.1 hypothetical protein E3O45_07855 [Cryobacterium sp. TMS1-20-1]